MGTKIEKFTPTAKLAYFINKKLSRENFIKTMEIYFSIPKIILRNAIFQKITKTKVLCKIVNSLILIIEIRKIEQKNPLNAIIVHHAYGTECPHFHDINKTFFYIHGTLTKTWLWGSRRKNRRIKKIFHNKRIIACSKTSYIDFFNTHIKTKSLDYVLNGIPIKKTQLLAQESLPKEYQGIDYIVCIARLSEEKQIPEMIEAYVKSNINAKFIIIGDGDQKNIIQNTIKELNCAENVILYGRDENPHRWLKNAKFSMLFSRHEGAPRTIPESLACGTPVIMGDQGGCHEYYKNTKSLQKDIIDYKDIHALSEAIKDLYANPIEVSEALMNKYDYEVHIKGLITILKNKNLL